MKTRLKVSVCILCLNSHNSDNKSHLTHVQLDPDLHLKARELKERHDEDGKDDVQVAGRGDDVRRELKRKL